MYANVNVNVDEKIPDKDSNTTKMEMACGWSAALAGIIHMAFPSCPASNAVDAVISRSVSPDADGESMAESQDIRANEHTGAQVPATVTRRQSLRPTMSESFPNKGHDMKARIPLTNSANPIIRYTRSWYFSSNKCGSTALVRAKARNSNSRTGKT
jgi:hypothetical protein